MVKNYLYHLSIILWLLTINFVCHSETNYREQLELHVEKSNYELGRPIRVHLYGIDLNTKISDVEITALNKNFGVISDYVINDTTDKRWPNRKVQILKLKIYPRRTGEITIPKIYKNNISTNDKTIIVKKGNTSFPEVISSTKKPYEQEQFIVLVKILSPHSTSRLLINPDPETRNFEFSPLKFQRNKNKNGMYQLSVGWAITALKSGNLNLKLPPVEYTVSGVSRKKFYLDSKKINIKALPNYLPPTIPVGEISIKSHIDQKGMFSLGVISYWNINIKGKLNTSYKLPPVLRQIKSNSKTNFKPANSIRSSEIKTNSLTSVVNHSIPFKTLKNGYISFPEIKLQYFSPAIGKIVTLTHKTNDVFVINIFWKVLISILLVLSILYVFKFFHIEWKQFTISRSKRMQAIQVLEGKNIQSIQKALKLLIESERWTNNLSINQWGDKWKSKYQTNVAFDCFLETLSSCIYSSSKTCDTNKLCLQLIDFITDKKKI